MEEIIAPVDKSLLKAELTPGRKLRNTNKGGNELYVFKGFKCPNLMREVGRLREEAFRAEGGATGLACDVDEHDLREENPFHQLIVWDPDAEAIIGGYRFMYGPEMPFHEDGTPMSTAAHIFKFSKEFIEDYLPHSIELGRSFVSIAYQSSKAGAKALFALDNLFDGLVALIVQRPSITYFYGKMTVHPSYDPLALDMLMYFLKKHFPTPDGLMAPKKPYKIKTDERLLGLVLNKEDYNEDYHIFKASIKKLGSFIPPLVNTYMNLSPDMMMFGGCPNPELNNAVEIGIMINFATMYDEKKNRHLNSFSKWLAQEMQDRFPGLKEEDSYLKFIQHWNEKRIKAMDRIRANREEKKLEKAEKKHQREEKKQLKKAQKAKKA